MSMICAAPRAEAASVGHAAYHRAESCADAVAQLVRERAVEGAEALLALGYLRAREHEELRGRGLLDHGDRLKQARRARHELGARALGFDVFDGFREKLKQDAAEDLVLFEQLVLVEPLRVAQRAELHRLGDHRCFGKHRAGGVFDVVRDAEDEQRDVVDEVVRREDAIRFERYPIGDAKQPAAREDIALISEPAGERDGEWAVGGGVHRRLLSCGVRNGGGVAVVCARGNVTP